jgi:two-component system cell cycle sensor histidine kinase/response regulator CckA
VASLKRSCSTPELQPGSHTRTGGQQVLGALSTPALGCLLNFLECPAEISTLDGKVVYANEQLEHFTGCRLGELLNGTAVWYGDETVAREGLTSVRAGVAWSGTLCRPSGDAYTVLLVPLFDADGKVASCLTLIRNPDPITVAPTSSQRGAAVAQGHRLDTLGRMAGGIAHDFNNMLGVIGNYAELALRRTEPGDPVREAVLRIHEAAQRSSRLTRQLLVLSRGEETEVELLDLNAVLFGLEELLKTTAGDQVALRSELVAAPATVRISRAQLEQVLFNLTANARDAMPDGGTIVLRTRNEVLDERAASRLGDVPAGSYVVLELEDSGTGMTDEVANQVFEPFFTTKESGSGRGLGLSIIYSIVSAAEGHILLRSEPGMGTTFLVYLPNRSTLISTKPSPPYQRSVRVLVVDDEAPVRRAVSKLVAGAGFEVLVARDAGEALQVLAEQRVHLLLTDVVMPGMSGIALAEIVGDQYPEVGIVYMSGYAHDVITERGLDPTQMLYLQKPFTRLELLRMVKRALGGTGDVVVGER